MHQVTPTFSVLFMIFEVLTVVFGVKTPCSLIGGYWTFEGNFSTSYLS